MKRVYNYSAGPSMLPVEVLEQAQKEMLCYGESGMSVMEMSHRSKDFEAIIKQAEQDLRELMHIPDNYKVLFVQGGGSTQFAMVPLNLMNKNKKANYINTGQWAKKAYAEAKRYGDVKVIASSEDAVYNYIPKVNKEDIDPEADYVYITLNNTIYGTHYTADKLPDTGDIPLVGDMSSNILAEEIDITKFGLIFAGTCVGGEGMIAFASSFPGAIIPFDITPGNDIIVQKSGFLASEAGVQLSIHFQKRLGAGFFGGEGFIMQRLSGQGTAFVEVDGAVVNYNLAPGQQMVIDTGYLVAMDPSVQMAIQQVPGLKNKFLGGEGLFNTVVTGPGRIWLQTMPINTVAGLIAAYIPGR